MQDIEIPVRVTNYIIQITKKITDHDLQTLPRAIYNDFIGELQHREEGFSGKLSKDPIKDLLLLNDQDFGNNLAFLSRAPICCELDSDEEEAEDAQIELDLAAQKNNEKSVFNSLGNLFKGQTTKSVPNLNVKSNTNVNQTPKEDRTVVITDWGIDILNYNYRNIIKPIEKPKIASPVEEPCHLKLSKAIVKPYLETARFGAIKNTINSTDAGRANECHAKCKDMLNLQAQSNIKSAYFFEKESSRVYTINDRGLSFRGTGQLESLFGWKAPFADFEEEGSYLIAAPDLARTINQEEAELLQEVSTSPEKAEIMPVPCSSQEEADIISEPHINQEESEILTVEATHHEDTGIILELPTLPKKTFFDQNDENCVDTYGLDEPPSAAVNTREQNPVKKAAIREENGSSAVKEIPKINSVAEPPANQINITTNPTVNLNTKASKKSRLELLLEKAQENEKLEINKPLAENENNMNISNQIQVDNSHNIALPSQTEVYGDLKEANIVTNGPAKEVSIEIESDSLNVEAQPILIFAPQEISHSEIESQVENTPPNMETPVAEDEFNENRLVEQSKETPEGIPELNNYDVVKNLETDVQAEILADKQQDTSILESALLTENKGEDELIENNVPESKKKGRLEKLKKWATGKTSKEREEKEKPTDDTNSKASSEDNLDEGKKKKGFFSKVVVSLSGSKKEHDKSLGDSVKNLKPSLSTEKLTEINEIRYSMAAEDPSKRTSISISAARKSQLMAKRGKNASRESLLQDSSDKKTSRRSFFFGKSKSGESEQAQRLELERVEKQRLEQESWEAEKREQERWEAERITAENFEKENRAEAERREELRLRDLEIELEKQKKERDEIFNLKVEEEVTRKAEENERLQKAEEKRVNDAQELAVADSKRKAEAEARRVEELKAKEAQELTEAEAKRVEELKAKEAQELAEAEARRVEELKAKEAQELAESEAKRVEELKVKEAQELAVADSKRKAEAEAGRVEELKAKEAQELAEAESRRVEELKAKEAQELAEAEARRAKELKAKEIQELEEAESKRKVEELKAKVAKELSDAEAKRSRPDELSAEEREENSRHNLIPVQVVADVISLQGPLPASSSRLKTFDRPKRPGAMNISSKSQDKPNPPEIPSPLLKPNRSAPIKPKDLGPKSGRFLNAMDIQKIQARRSKIDEDVPIFVSNAQVEPSKEDIVMVPQARAAPVLENSSLTNTVSVTSYSTPLKSLKPLEETIISSNLSLNTTEKKPPSNQALQNLKNEAPSEKLPARSNTEIAHESQKWSENWLSTVQKIVWKDHKCELKIADFELHCFEIGKPKQQYKPYLPMSLRQIVHLSIDKAVVTITCVVSPSEKEPKEFKTIAISFTEGAAIAQQWKDHMNIFVFGGALQDLTKRGILILVEKSDKDSHKLVDKYMVEVLNASKRPTKVLSIQLNEFSVINALSKENVESFGNIVVTNPDFLPRLQQVLVRDQLSSVPQSLTTDTDPIDCSIDIIRSCVGRKNVGSLFVTGVRLEREAARGIKGFFKK